MKLNDEERNGIKQLIIKDKKTKQNKININKKIMIKFFKKKIKQHFYILTMTRKIKVHWSSSTTPTYTCLAPIYKRWRDVFYIILKVND
jgi:hypothetical protein